MQLATRNLDFAAHYPLLTVHCSYGLRQKSAAKAAAGDSMGKVDNEIMLEIKDED
ncbi:MAG: hypothetical protein HZB54_05875 [Deltaproteobacteria bacterium]|nr:hypothetical protein [Deltaproteobacteria bacterium]